MIITFATQKGGAGKTTLAVAFANYLALTTTRKINGFDFDFQSSFYKRWKDDAVTGLPALYPVKYVDPNVPFEGLDELFGMVESDDINLFDLAGALDEKYQDLLIYSSFVIIPFEYTSITIRSTMEFVSLLQLIGSESQRVFIPSRYDKGYNYRNKPAMDKELVKHGFLVERPIYKRNCLQSITTRGLTPDQMRAVGESFMQIIDFIQNILQLKL